MVDIKNIKVVKEKNMKNYIVKTGLNVINNKTSIMRVENIDYISLTDLAR